MRLRARLLPSLPPRLGRLVAVGAAAALLAGAVAALPAQAATGAVYQVDCSAKASGDGSAAAPWNSLAAVNAHGAFAPGDQILLKRGTTCKGILSPSGSGTATAKIVLGAYPSSGAKPTVAGGGTGNNTGAVQLINESYWTVQDLHITNANKGTNTKTYRTGLLLQSDNGGVLAGLTAQRLTIDSVNSNPGNGNTRAYGGISALTFGSKVKSGFSGLRILNNTVTKVSRTGIITSNSQYPKSADTDVRIAGNPVSHVRGDGIVLIGAKSSRIDHNRVSYVADLGSCSHCGRYGGPSTASAGIWPSNTQDALIEYNEVWGTHKAGGDGEGFDIDRSAVRTVMQYNYAHDNEGGAVLVCGAVDSVIRFNVFENNKQSVLSFYGKAPAKNTSFYNNTIYASGASSAKIVRTFGGIKGGKVSFKNNIVYSYGPGTYQWPSKQIATASNTLVGRQGAGRPTGNGTVWANPGLRAPGTGKTGFSTLKGYRLKTTKGARTGSSIPRSVTKDFFGKKVNPAKPVRGAASSS